MKKVYIIVLNWNRKKDTLECLAGTQELVTNGFEPIVVVVDNASADGSVQAFKKFKSKFKLHVLENKTNLGFAAGNNEGINFALNQNADYILILNNDTVVDASLISELLKSAERHKDGGAFSPKIYFAKGFEFHKDRYKDNELGKVFWAAGGAIDWANVFGKNRGVDEVDRGQYEKEERVKFATGACVLYRAEALKNIGLFDEKYFMYFEDVDLSVRLTKAGWKIYYVPQAVLWHKVAQSSGIGSGLNDYFISRNRLLFGTKYASFRTKFALFREAVRMAATGRPWQKKGIADFFLGKFGKGSWK